MKPFSKLLGRAVRAAFATVLVLLPGTSPAQNAAAQFPEAGQVAADFRDPAESYVALNLLWDALRSAAPEAVGKRGAYYNTCQAIRQREMMMGNQAAADFDTRVAQLMRDPNFRRAVLAKYRLTNVRAEPAAAQTQRRNTDVTDSMIKAAFWKASPFMLAAVVAMYLLIHAMVRNATASPTLNSPTRLANDGLPPLPESLRVVKVPGLEYPVDVLSGRIVDKESRTNTTVHTTTTQGPIYTMDNQVYSRPVTTHTSVRTTQTDLVWAQSLDGHENSWTFTGGTFQTRPGHVISAIARPLPAGNTEFLAVYNHTTGQFEKFGTAAHLTRRGRWAWPAAALVGSIGFAVAFGIILSIQPPEISGPADRVIYPISLWVEGMVVSGIVALFMVLIVKKKIWKKRNAWFDREYVPGFRQFLEQRTSALEQCFAVLK